MSITFIILLLTVATSIIGFSNPTFLSKGMLNPYMVHNRKEYWRLISSGFLHAGFFHLLINMMVLLGFGTVVEMYYREAFPANGKIYFTILYLGSILVANVPSLNKHKDNVYYNSLGASGAVAAILFASILFDPWQKIYIFGILPLPGVILGPLYLFFEYTMSKRGGTNINHDAHFYGAIFGLLYTIILDPTILKYFINVLMNPPF
jgi:membrane associated rhomboid family serine protease